MAYRWNKNYLRTLWILQMLIVTIHVGDTLVRRLQYHLSYPGFHIIEYVPLTLPSFLA